MDPLRDLAPIRSRDHSARPRPHVRDLLCHLHRSRDHDRAPALAAGEEEPSLHMSEAEIVAAILWLALTAYAVLVGADFGGGVWDLLASGPRARDQRRAVAEAMGPVWEANHVWLIFLIVGLFTGFPAAFGILSMALYVPLTVALVGIVLRGAAFAFRAHGREAVGDASPWGVAFGAASVIAPFFLAGGAAAVASGAIRVSGGRLVSGFETGWATPYGVLVGLFAVALCAYLAATYLTVETEGTPLESDFRRRAAAAGLVAGVAAIASLLVAPFAAPSLAHALFGRVCHFSSSHSSMDRSPLWRYGARGRASPDFRSPRR